MSNRTIQIRVYKEDWERMKTSGIKLFLEEHPEFKDVELTQAFLFRRMLKFWFKE